MSCPDKQNIKVIFIVVIVLFNSSAACSSCQLLSNRLLGTAGEDYIDGEILNPPDQSIFFEGDEVTLRGTYTGPYICERTFWTSSIDGDLQAESDKDCVFEITLTNLSPGDHTIKFGISDPYESDNDTITIQILPLEAEGKVIIEETNQDQLIGAEGAEDAYSCDALTFIDFELIEGPIEETRDNGRYTCYISYSISNTHESNNIVVSWKQEISTANRKNYWTHPELEPGGSYYVPLTLRSELSADGVWTYDDADHLMAWFASSDCDRYINQFWPTEKEPDKLLTAGLTWSKIENPCRR